ncbi:MAG: type II secretion system protein [Anaerolineae bacterium]
MDGCVTRNEKGFTLIELLIVVGMIGLLAAIAVVNLIPAQQRARYAKAAGDTKEIVTHAMVLTSDNSAVAQGPAPALGLTMPVALWDTSAPNSVTYMAVVSDPWAAGTPCLTGALGEACYVFSQVAAVGCAIGPGCVVYSALSVGANGAPDGVWTGLFPAVPANDDLGSSTVMGCAFGPNVGIANPC